MGIQLQIETTNVCNADCVFCPYSTHTRPKGTMDLDLFKRIVDEAATVETLEKLTLTGLGETLLDRHLVERVRYARERLPVHVYIDLYTNGTFLTPLRTDALIEAGLDVLYVSLNATNAEKRREVMHLDDYERVVEQTQYAVAAFDLRAAKLGHPSPKRNRWRVIVKAVASKDLMELGDPEQFQRAWRGDHEVGGNAYLHLEGNWAGATGQKMRTQPREACHRALSQIMVLWDGRVSLCCFDSEGAVILGDLNHQTLREMYAGEPALHYRLAHHEGRRSELPLCNTCTGI